MKNIVTYRGFAGASAEIDLYLAKGDEVKLVFFYHGFKGFKDWGAWQRMAPIFNKEGFSLAIINGTHNGIGHSETEITELDKFARNSISAEQKDIKEAISATDFHLKQVGKVVSEKHLIGHSRGGANAIIYAAFHTGLKSVSSWAGVANWEALFSFAEKETWAKDGKIYVKNSRTGQELPLGYEIWKDYEENKDRFDIVKAASLVTIPLLIIHGSEDKVVPLSHAQDIYESCLHSLMMQIDGAGHTFETSHPWESDSLPPAFLEVLENTIDFISDSDIEMLY
jgi:uncharacterized protein